MLDKSLVYKDIVMCLPFEELKTLKVPVLPDGYSYKMFEPGDEVAWANLEVLVGEFNCFEDASAYFAKTFLAHEELLADRVCFIVNPEGEIVATTSAWFKMAGDVRFFLKSIGCLLLLMNRARGLGGQLFCLLCLVFLLLNRMLILFFFIRILGLTRLLVCIRKWDFGLQKKPCRLAGLIFLV